MRARCLTEKGRGGSEAPCSVGSGALGDGGLRRGIVKRVRLEFVQMAQGPLRRLEWEELSSERGRRLRAGGWRAEGLSAVSVALPADVRQ